MIYDLRSIWNLAYEFEYISIQLTKNLDCKRWFLYFFYCCLRQKIYHWRGNSEGGGKVISFVFTCDWCRYFHLGWIWCNRYITRWCNQTTCGQLFCVDRCCCYGWYISWLLLYNLWLLLKLLGLLLLLLLWTQIFHIGCRNNLSWK